MDKQGKHWRPILLFGLLCSLAALVLVGFRIQTEQPMKQVCPVIRYQELSALADQSPYSLEDWCAALADAGLQRLLTTPQELEDPAVRQLLTQTGLRPIQLGGAAAEDVYCYEACYDESAETAPPTAGASGMEALSRQEILGSLDSRDSILVLVENESQTGPILPAGFGPEDYSGRIAKCFWLNQEYRSAVGALDYTGTEEVENYLFRAVIDRGMNVLWLAPLATTDGTALTEPDQYVDLLHRLGSRLEAAGYRYGDVQGLAVSEPSRLLQFFTGLAVLCGVLLLADALLPLSRQTILISAALALAENGIGFLCFPGIQLPMLALLASICFPCLSVVLLWRQLQQAGRWGSRLLLQFAAGFAGCIAMSLWGAMLISALLSGSAYLLVLRLFRGVKLSQAAVYGFALFYSAWVLLHHRGNSLREDLSALREGRRRRFSPGFALLLILAAAAGLIYLLRTGDQMIAVSSLERRIRNQLEHWLIYRPRTKEFLLAWPAAGLAFLFASRHRTGLCWLCGLLTAIGFASLVNTFCHSRAHFLNSLARTGIGLGIGLGFALILLLLHDLLSARQTPVTADSD